MFIRSGLCPSKAIVGDCTTLTIQFWGFVTFMVVLGAALLWNLIRTREPATKMQMVRVAKIGEAKGGESVYAAAPTTPGGAWVPINANVMEVRTLADARAVRAYAKENSFAAYELMHEVGRDVLDMLDPEFVGEIAAVAGAMPPKAKPRVKPRATDARDSSVTGPGDLA